MILLTHALKILVCLTLVTTHAKEVDTLCRSNNHVIGQWVKNESITVKRYYSCGWGDHDYLNNPAQCGPSSREKDFLLWGSQALLTQTGGWAHECDKRDETRNIVSKREQYEWQPMLCDLIPWNHTQFCSLLGERKILFLGDSTMHQTAAATMSRITHDAMGVAADSCAHQLVIGRRNRFSPEQKVLDLANYFELTKPDIVIINIGAHVMTYDAFEKDIKLLDAFVESVVEYVKTEPYYHNRTVKFVWRTNHPGHVNCTIEDRLVEHWSHQVHKSDRYNWWFTPIQDRIAKKYVLGPRTHPHDTSVGSFVGHVDFRVIDMSPLYYRQDAHPGIESANDCLHYCMPGPVDLFSQLLLNMMANEGL